MALTQLRRAVCGIAALLGEMASVQRDSDTLSGPGSNPKENSVRRSRRAGEEHLSEPNSSRDTLARIESAMREQAQESDRAFTADLERWKSGVLTSRNS